MAADAELDYAAVMESRTYLRGWEQTGWPEDDFTVEANRADLEKLERRHATREAFTYTVMNPAETEYLGCVYLMPTDGRSFAGRASLPSAVIDGTTTTRRSASGRRSRLETATDRSLLEVLQAWLAKDWRPGGHLIVTSELFAQQVDLIARTDLQLRFTEPFSTWVSSVARQGRSPW